MQTSSSEMLRAFRATSLYGFLYLQACMATLPASTWLAVSLLQAFLAFCDTQAFMADTCVICKRMVAALCVCVCGHVWARMHVWSNVQTAHVQA